MFYDDNIAGTIYLKGTALIHKGSGGVRTMQSRIATPRARISRGGQHKRDSNSFTRACQQCQDTTIACAQEKQILIDERDTLCAEYAEKYEALKFREQMLQNAEASFRARREITSSIGTLTPSVQASQGTSDSTLHNARLEQAAREELFSRMRGGGND
jgi:hypothetical protein